MRAAFAWVHRTAHVLGEVESSGTTVRARLAGLLGAMTRHRAAAGGLAGGVDHIVEVTRSDGPGLFARYGVAGLPRTNNGLEREFGSHRQHERRATGRTGASSALVQRGAARLVAGLATRSREVTAAELASADPAAWRALRAGLEERRQRRIDRRRFRRDPDGYRKTWKTSSTGPDCRPGKKVAGTGGQADQALGRSRGGFGPKFTAR